MSTNIGRIVAEITANTAGLRRGAADAQRILSDTSNNASAAGKAINIAFAVTSALGVAKLIDKLEDCTQVAIDNKKALMGLESVAKAYRVSVEDATKATKDFTNDGLLQMKSATTGMKNILSTNFSVSEAMNLSQAFKDIGAFNNVTGDLGQAYEDVTKGMRTGSIELIENIGLTQKLSAVMKAANVDISNGIDLTNNAAQREAFYNMVLKEGEKFKGNAAKLANDQASAQDKANAAMKEAADAIGNKVLPAYSELMGVVTNLAKETSELFKGTEFSKANNEIESQKTKLSDLTSMYLSLKDNTNKSNIEQELFLQCIEDLKRSYPDFLGKIDLQNIKTSSAITLFDELNNQLERQYVNQLKDAELKDLYTDKAKLVKEQLETTKELYSLQNKLKKQEASGTNYILKDITKELIGRTQAKLDGLTRGIDTYDKKILKTKDSWDAVAYEMDSNKKTTVYTKPDFLVKLEKDTKEAQRIQAELDKKNAEEEVAKKSKKETFSLDVSETTNQKLIEQEYKYKTDLANAKEEEKWRVELENKKAVAIINATAEAEKKISAIRKKVESGNLSEKAGRSQAVAINEQLASDIGIFELSEATAKNKAEKAYEKFGKALGLLDINNYIDSENLELEVTIEPVFTQENKKYSARDKLFGYGEGHFNPAVGLTDPSKYQTTFAQQGTGGKTKKDAEYVNKTLNDVTKSFSELAGVLDNEVISAISNIANEAMSMKGSISGFSAAQGAGDTLGMLSSGLGMFSSAVGIFSAVGGLFNKSTYNFDEAVKKMLAGIGEKTPELQVAEYQKALDLKKYLSEQGLSEKYYAKLTATQNETLKAMGIKTQESIQVNNQTGELKITYNLGSNAIETLAALDKIIPQLAEQLGTAAGDFGSAIGSALSSATTSEELKANLYDSIYGTVKSGLINAFLAGEVMKPLLENLQQTVTLAVSNGVIDDTEKAAIQALLGDVGIKTDTFYSALEAVGLNVVDAAGQLNEAANRMDNVNRNLRLADRISTITTQTSRAGITQLAGNSSVVYDFSSANLGGMTEQQVISAVSKANRMASIRKVGV